MSDVLGQSEGVAPRSRRIMVAYLRVVALFLLAAGMARAAYLLGIDFNALPFQSHTLTWQLGLVGLLFLNLFSGVGLWIAAPWGQVVWIIAALIEIAMLTVFSQQFGSDVFRVVVHVFFLLIYFGLLGFNWMTRRRD